MLKTILLFALTLALPLALPAQNYSFSPSNEIYGVLEMDMYTEHYLYIGHDLQDSAYITWRLVGNTCPAEWDIQACDYQHCYTGLPNDGDMNGVAPGGQGYLRMIVNPFLTAGSGVLHFLIFPTGEPLNYTDAYFYLNTTALSTVSQLQDRETAVVLRDEILYSGPILGKLDLYNLSGKCVASAYMSASSHRFTISDLPSGLFILKTPTGNTIRIVKPH